MSSPRVQPRHVSQQGLTLIEMLLATLVLSLVIGLVSPMLMNAFHVWQRTESASASLHELRKSLDTLTQAIETADAITAAGTQSLTIRQGSDTVGYALQAGNLVTWQGDSPKYTLTASVNEFSLRYLNADGDLLSGSPLTEEQIDSIRALRISLTLADFEGHLQKLQTSIYRQPGRYVLLQEGYVPQYALLSQGDADLEGEISITGARPHLHSNGNLLMQVSDTSVVEGDVSAAGTVTIVGNPLILGEIREGDSPVTLPTIAAANYQSWADAILASDGTVHNGDGDLIAGGNYAGWQWQAGIWVQSDTHPSEGCYYGETDILVQGGEDAGLWRTTLISEGQIRIEGKHHLEALKHDLLLLADGGIEIHWEPGEGAASDERILAAGHLVTADDFLCNGPIRLTGAMIAAGSVEVQGVLEIEYSPSAERVFPDLFARVESWQRVAE